MPELDFKRQERLERFQSTHSGKLPRYYAPSEVALHNTDHDCWVSAFNFVYDISKVVNSYRGLLTKPILQHAGHDVTHWFDTRTQDVLHHTDPASGLRVPYTPEGRFVHVDAGAVPTSDCDMDFEKEWWKDDRYIIGCLTEQSRQIRIVNTLSSQDDTIEVCSEETLNEIQDRYLSFNSHAASYTWKRLGKPLDMTKTLDDNGVIDERPEYKELGLSEDYYIPALYLYYNDDLTVA
eukprot:20030_1